MFNEFMKKDGLRLWQIQIGEKKPGRYYDTHTVNVSADTVELAIEKIREKYPEGKIISVNHKGSIDL